MKLSEQNKRMIWKANQRKRDSYERTVARMFKSALNKQVRQAMGVFNKHTSPLDKLDDALRMIEPELLLKPLKYTYKTVGSAFARASYKEVGTPKKEDKNFEQLMEQWLIQHGGEEITLITATTKKEFEKIVRRTMADAANSGLSVDNAAKLLRKRAMEEMGKSNFYRAQRIARTEIVRASNHGSLEGVRATGLAVDKIWLSTRDSRTRDTHYDMDGVRVDKDAEFIVGGIDHMDSPGMGSVASENINCRCTLIYDRKEIQNVGI